jgi:hypothetical protein
VSISSVSMPLGVVVMGVGTELDENGSVRVGMQAFKKMELCTMVTTPQTPFFLLSMVLIGLGTNALVAWTIAPRSAEIRGRNTSFKSLHPRP